MCKMEMSEERAKYIAESLGEPSRDEPGTVEFRDPVKQLGFAMLPHIVTLDRTLSNGAFRCYALLFYFWQQKHKAWPSVETLAGLLDVSRATLSVYLNQLIEHKLISRDRRIGTSTVTYIEDLPQEYVDAARSILTDRREAKSETNEKLDVSGKENLTSSSRKLDVLRQENLTKRITIEEEPPEEEQRGEGETKNVSPATPQPPTEHKPHAKRVKEPPPPAVQVVRDELSRFPPKAWWQEIVDTVGVDPGQLEFWRKVLHDYSGCGWNPCNIKAQLDFFRRRELPVGKANGNGNGNAHAPPRSKVEIIDAGIQMYLQRRANGSATNDFGPVKEVSGRVSGTTPRRGGNGDSG